MKHHRTKLKLFGFLFASLSAIPLGSYAVDCNNFFQTGVPKSQCLALVDLYNSTNENIWNENCRTNWLSNQPIKDWYGVEVQASGVTALRLYSCGLKGTIPSSIGNLTDLKKLHLQMNSLYGNPGPIGNLSNLEELTLSNNQFSGTIPENFNNLTNLNKLWLGNNQFTGEIPNLENLDNLSMLELLNNKLSGSIPSSLGNLTNLHSLVLSYNQLSGNIPESLGNLFLIYLYLNSNQLSGNIPSSLGNLNYLNALFLDHNKLSGSIPSSLGNLVNLKFLLLDNNQLSGPIPYNFGNLMHLEFLYLHDNNLTGTLSSNQFHPNLDDANISLTRNCFDDLTSEFVNYVITSPIGFNQGGFFYFYDQKTDCKKVKSNGSSNTVVEGAKIDPSVLEKFRQPVGFELKVPELPQFESGTELQNK